MSLEAKPRTFQHQQAVERNAKLAAENDNLALESIKMAAKVRLMESILNFNKLREANVRRCEDVFHKLHDWSPTDWATAMAGECGEACNEIKKLRRLDGADADADTAENRHWLKVNIAHELADLVIYADLLAARLDIDLGEAIKFKFNEVSDKRKSMVKL